MDPVTMAIIAGVGMVGNSIDQYNTNQAHDEMMSKLASTGELIKDKYTEMFDIAKDYQIGGQFFKMAEQNAIDTAFVTAQKGNEDLKAKGINMTSYGTGVATDVIKDKFTSTLIEDYMDISKIGLSYNTLAGDMMGDYVDLTTGAAQSEFMNEANQFNPLTYGADLAMDFAGMGGFGSSTPSTSSMPTSSNTSSITSNFDFNPGASYNPMINEY